MGSTLDMVSKNRPDLTERWNRLEQLIPRDGNVYQEWTELVKRVQNTEFFYIPASAHYHLSQPYGLLEHSLNVAETCIKLMQLMAPKLPLWWGVVGGLMHDLGKANPGYGRYIKNEPTEKQRKYGYSPKYPYSFERDKSYIYFDHEDFSVIMVSRFMPSVPLPVLQGIRCHNGQYVDGTSGYSSKETPFALLLHWADCWSGFVIEDRIV